MSNIWDDLFESYRRYKWINVDNPQYEPLESWVMSKDEIKKLKAKEYADKNKDKLKIKRLEKIVDNLRAENKTLKENQKQVWVEDERAWLLSRIEELEETNQTLLRERNSKAEKNTNEYNALANKAWEIEKEFAEFRKAVWVIMKYL